MPAPAGCEQINVTGASVSDVDGAYTFDEATQSWINDNNVEWSLEKVWWEKDSLGVGKPAASGYKWSFIFSGDVPPPNSETVHFLQHPLVVGSADANGTDGWAKNSAAAGGTLKSAEYNPVGPNGWHYMPPPTVDCTRFTDSSRTTVLEQGTLNVQWPSVYTYPGGDSSTVNPPSVLEWAANFTIPAQTFFTVTGGSWSNNLETTVPSLNFYVKDEQTNFPSYTWNTWWAVSYTHLTLPTIYSV